MPERLARKKFQLALGVKYIPQLENKAKMGYLKKTDKELIYHIIIWATAQFKNNTKQHK